MLEKKIVFPAGATAPPPPCPPAMYGPASAKLIEFQFNFLHRRVPTNNFIFRIGLQGDENCRFCHTSPESLIHLFWLCRQTSLFWNKVTAWLKNLKLLILHCFGSEARYPSFCASYQLLFSLSRISHMAR